MLLTWRTSVLVLAKHAHGFSAFGAELRMLGAAGGVSALGAGQGRGSAFPGIFDCRIVAEADGFFAAQ